MSSHLHLIFISSSSSSSTLSLIDPSHASMVFVSYALSAAMDGIERQLCIVVSEEGWMLANQKKSLLRTTQKLADSYVVARREVLYGDDIYIKDMELSAMFLVQLISQFPSQIELVESEVGEQEDVCGS